jgi:hypothetical protein
MSTHKLIIGFREDKVTNLTASIYTVQLSEVDGVPEADALVSSATTSSQETSVKRTPVDCLHSCLMI